MTKEQTKAAEKIELRKLRKFYRAVAKMTVDHEVIYGSACVTARRLGEALEIVSPDWVEDAGVRR